MILVFLSFFFLGDLSFLSERKREERMIFFKKKKAKTILIYVFV